MNVAGKSLQDIYDSGSRRLDELEQSEKASLADAADAHLDERARVEPDSLKNLEDKTNELEAEIRAFLNRGVERVQKTVAAESEESEQHINRLVEGLVLVTKKFSESIAQLRKMAESQLSDQGDDCEHVYSLRSQTVSSELLREGTVAIASTREEATASERKIGEQVEQSWESVYEKEADALEALTDCFDKDAEQVSERFEQTRKSLEDRAHERLNQLQEQSKSSQNSIKALVDRVIEQSDRFAFDTDVKLKEGFSSLLYELTTSFDDSALRSAADVATLHDSSMAELLSNSQELNREMDNLAESITKSANERSIGLQDEGNAMLEDYTSEQNAKLDASNVFHKELAAERAHMVSEIWNELTQLRESFDAKLKELSSTTLEKMRNICEEAETAIVTAQDSCCSDSKSNAATKQATIDKAAKDFLRKVEKTRKAALDGIAKAAGEEASGAESAAADSSSLSGQSDPDSTSAAQDDSPALSASPEAESEGEDDSGAEQSGQSNPRPSGETEESGGDARKRRKGRSDKRSSGEAKK